MKLFKFLSNKSDQIVNTIEHKVAAKTTNEIIDEIHDDFYTEVDKLLADAKIGNSLETDKQDLIAKCKRLEALGFTNTKEVCEAKIELARIETLKQENNNKAHLMKAINHFSMKYPLYKFITGDSVRKICEKYNLVYGAIDKYIGDVPDKNLKHIENFKISDDDQLYLRISRHISSWADDDSNITFISKADSELREKQEREYRSSYSHLLHSRTIVNIEKAPLEIVAPVKDFNMTKQEIKNFKVSNIFIPDPVVLQPVIYDNSKYYLIVTAWGEEASDELVVNQKMN